MTVSLLVTTCVAAMIAMPAAATAQVASPASTTDGQTPNAAPEQNSTDISALAKYPDAMQQAGDRVNSKKVTQNDDVVVTGTRIHNPNMRSAAPIQTITSQEIKLSGAVNIEDVLNRLPQVVAYNPSAAQEDTGAARVGLRNFGGGPGPTLTLIDGLRVTGGGGGDINQIPPSLIERVDILTGGAAAVYGADAVSGVVNFVLKRNFDGIQIDADYGLFDHLNRRNAATAAAQASGFSSPLGMVNDGGRATINVSAGKTLLDDRLSLSAYFTYRHTNPVLVTDRSYNACQVTQLSFNATPTCIATLTNPNGYIVPQSGPNAGTAFVNSGDGTSRQFHVFGNSDFASLTGSSYQALHENQRYNAGGFLNFKATAFAEIYGSFLYSKNQANNTYDPTSVYAGSYNDSGYTLNCNNPLMSAQQAQSICGSAAGTGAIVPIDFRYRLNGYPAQAIYNTQYNARATLGVRGDFGGAWHYDVAGVYSSAVSYRVIDSNSNADPTRISNALNVVNVNGVPTCVARVNGTDPACVPFDIFVGNTHDLASYNYIFKGSPNGAQRSADIFADALATVSGDLGHYGIRSPLAKNGIQFAVNAEFRREVANNQTSAEYQSILAGSPNPGNSNYATQSTKEIGFEIQIPLIEDKFALNALSIDGGYRRSKYSTASASYGTWKVEGIWAPTEDIKFRASRNFASRAPNVYEANPASSFAQVVNNADPCGPVVGSYPHYSLNTCRQTVGWNDSYYNNPSLLCPDTGCVFRTSGQPNLGPQEANSYTVGVVLTPRIIPRLSITVDRYTIRFTNQIQSFEPADFIAACALYDAQPNAFNQLACQHIVRNSTGQLFGSTSDPSTGFISGDTINTPSSTGSQGWDFQGHYDAPIASAGRLAMDFNGGLVTNAGSATNASGKVGYFGKFVGVPVPKWRHNFRTTFTTLDGVFQTSVNWRFVGGTVSGANHCLEIIGVACTSDVVFGADYPGQTNFSKIKPYNYFDLSASVNVAKRLTIGITINNLFDKDPPLIPTSGAGRQYSINGYQNVLTDLYDPYGRYIQISATTRF